MRFILFTGLLLVAVGHAHSQQTNPNYDEALAKEVGADDYGMKSFIFVMLKTGANTTEGEERSEAFAGHMSNMNTMVEAGKLVVAGPMEKNDLEYRGIFILNVPTVEEALELLQTDPAIAQGYLEPLMFKWYGSAALSTYLENADKVWKVGF